MLSRTNIKLIPDAHTILQINNLLSSNGIPHDDFTSDPHCTIIYSHDIVDVKTISLPETNFPIIGTKAHLEFFDTKYDGIVLVIEFDCKSAKECFEYMKKTYNLTTRYNEYREHITLQKNITENLDMALPDINFDLVFDKIEMDNKE